MLLLLGGGVVACNLLPKSKGNGAGFLFVNLGWGLAVMMGVTVAYKSGGHLNPAVTLGIAASGKAEFVPGVAVNGSSISVYLAGEMLGAIIGALLMWITYKQHFDEECDPALKLACFSTAPEIRNYFWNMVTEIIGTFVLVFTIIASWKFAGPNAVNIGWTGALAVALLIVVIGTSLGGPTGYAINPVRDLGPRIVHQLVPIKGKGGSDWAYSWVPVFGPIVGGVLAGVLSNVLLP